MIQTIQEKRQAQRILEQGAAKATENIHRGQGRTSAAVLSVLCELAAGRPVIFVVVSDAAADILGDLLAKLAPKRELVTIVPMNHGRFQQDSLSVLGCGGSALVIDHAVIEKLEQERITAVRNAIFELEEWQAIATKRQVGA